MTEKQVMAALETSDQKERAQAIYMAAQRFGTKSPFDTMKDVKTAVDYVNNAVVVYNQRKEKQKQAYIKKQAEKADIDFLIKTYKEAIKNGATHQEVIDNIQGIYKAKHNARIKEQIEALKAQML
jgi:hypothetical protein